MSYLSKTKLNYKHFHFLIQELHHDKFIPATKSLIGTCKKIRNIRICVYLFSVLYYCLLEGLER